MVNSIMDESLICTNCGLKVKRPEVDNSLEICYNCHISLGILRPSDNTVS